MNITKILNFAAHEFLALFDDIKRDDIFLEGFKVIGDGGYHIIFGHPVRPALELEGVNSIKQYKQVTVDKDGKVLEIKPYKIKE